MDPIAANYPMWLVFLLPFVTKDGCTYKNIKHKHYPIITCDSEYTYFKYSVINPRSLKWELDSAKVISYDRKTFIRKMSLDIDNLEYVNLLLQSRYSDLPTTIKTQILNFWGASTNTVLFRVLNGQENVIWSNTGDSYGKYDFNLPLITTD